ncbi:pentatricopeptide repeat-containing protein At1g06140, mitochondrial-like [Neltuma alba]|uniref:pentatricopeptide repeat-containing protein At1g06140, mitochondrial-like n=1 Tax=Neltuma alba TaxID=207710 RepID=UPI0010A435A0|nr:pentatricopeptide repeat-containing protein At1g06140, mitochondrial-like [Prosopis alba]
MPLRLPSLSNFKRPLYLWNLIIRDSTNNGLFSETLNIYSSMARCGFVGNSFTYPLVLKACGKIASIRDGTKIHGRILRLGYGEDAFIQTALIDMYSRCSEIVYSRLVFDEMPGRSVVSWNAMISAYCRGPWLDEALILLKEMWICGFIPNSSTFVSILSGYSNLTASSKYLLPGLSVHCCLIKHGLEFSDISLTNSLMTMYVHVGQINGACQVFGMMHDKSLISWTTIIGGFLKVGNTEEAFRVFHQMRCQSTELDSVVFLNLASGCIQVGNLQLASSVHSLILKSGCDEEESIENALVSMYAKCRDLSSARRIFDLVNEKGILLWTSMITGYASSGHPMESLELFRKLLRTDIRPNVVTLATVASACADLGFLSMGQEIEEYILLNGFDIDKRIQASLIHMYSKCGRIKKARGAFEGVKDKDLVVWASMINGYAIHGMGKEAISLFHKMLKEEGLMPDAIVYTSILHACSHSGLVEDGLNYFKNMKEEFGIDPTVEHYTCLVDLLGRVGRLDLALDIIEGMPLEAQRQAWTPFLNACRVHANIQLGELAAAKLLDLGLGRPGNYVLMANLYTSLGKWKEAHMMRKLINSEGLVKECGWSVVEINGRFNMFSAGNHYHLQLVNIHKTLEELNASLLEASFIAEAMTENNDL